jgi:transposase
VVHSYKNLGNVEHDFPIIKADDLDRRPIHHRLEDRVKAHVLICPLACYLSGRNVVLQHKPPKR